MCLLYMFRPKLNVFRIQLNVFHFVYVYQIELDVSRIKLDDMYLFAMVVSIYATSWRTTCPSNSITGIHSSPVFVVHTRMRWPAQAGRTADAS